MPKAGEKCVPVLVPEESANDLQKIISNTGLRQSDVLRYSLVAALRVLAEKDTVALPIKFSVNGANGEHPKRGK